MLARLGHDAPVWPVHGADDTAAATGPLLRGLFVGGTLCDESMLLATEALGPVRSNIPLSDDLALDPGELLPDTHTFVDFGDDALTQGRDYVVPDDVKGLAEPVLAHRLVGRGWATGGSPDAGPVVREIVSRRPVPT